MRVFVGALLQANGCILLGHRSASRAFYSHVWDVPGGHCEQGDSVEQTLVRELHEEIGVTPTTWRKLAIVRSPDGENEMFELHLYLVTAWDGSPHNLLPEEHDHIAWFTVADACRLALASPQYPTLSFAKPARW